VHLRAARRDRLSGGWPRHGRGGLLHHGARGPAASAPARVRARPYPGCRAARAAALDAGGARLYRRLGARCVRGDHLYNARARDAGLAEAPGRRERRRGDAEQMTEKLNCGARRRVALLGIVAVLLQAILFGWHHHPLPLSSRGSPPAVTVANAALPLLPASAE